MVNFSTQSIDFDGSNDHVVIGDVGPFKFDVGDEFSVSCWFKTDGTGSEIIVSKLDGSSPNSGWELGTTSSAPAGRLFFQLIDDLTVPQRALVYSVEVYNNNTWHHFVVTKNTTELASGITLYVNGVAASVTVFDDTFVSNGGTSFDGTTPLQIGARDGTIAPFDGQIDDVAIYDKELTAGEVTTIYNSGRPGDLTVIGPTANVIGYWLMGEGDTFPTLTDQVSSTTVLVATDIMLDKSPNGINSSVLTTGGLEDADFSTNTPAGGNSSFALGPLGGNEYINIPNNALLDFEVTDPWTWSCWLRLNPGATKLAYSKRVQSGVFQGLWFGISGGGLYRCRLQSTTSGQGIEKRGTVDNGDEFNYVHCVWTYSGSETAAGLILYVNGATEPMTTQDDDFTTGSMLNSAPSFISDATPTLTWAGPGASQDEMCIWDRALTPSEVSDVYNLGTPLDNLALSSASAIVAYWGLGENQTSNDATMVNMVAGDIVEGGANQSYENTLLDITDLPDVGNDENPVESQSGFPTDWSLNPTSTPVGGEGFAGAPPPPVTIPDTDLISPAGGIFADTPIVVDVTDPDGFTSIILVAHPSPPGGAALLVYDGTNFRSGFAQFSTRTVIANGFRFSVRKDLGWDSSTNIEVYSFDTQGNEGA